MQLFIYENKKEDWKHQSSQNLLSSLANVYQWGELSYSDFGKPLIEKGYVSVSHTKNLLFIAYEQFPIGIDCEFPREISNHLIMRLQLNPANPIIDWCKHEAWIKLEDNPQHLTHKLSNRLKFKQIMLDNDCICIVASHQSIINIEIIKKS